MLPVRGAREEEGWRGSSKSLRSAGGERGLVLVRRLLSCVCIRGRHSIGRARDAYRRRDLSCHHPRGMGFGSHLSCSETPSSLTRVCVRSFAREQQDSPTHCR